MDDRLQRINDLIAYLAPDVEAKVFWRVTEYDDEPAPYLGVRREGEPWFFPAWGRNLPLTEFYDTEEAALAQKIADILSEIGEQQQNMQRLEARKKKEGGDAGLGG